MSWAWSYRGIAWIAFVGGCLFYIFDLVDEEPVIITLLIAIYMVGAAIYEKVPSHPDKNEREG